MYAETPQMYQLSWCFPYNSENVFLVGVEYDESECTVFRNTALILLVTKTRQTKTLLNSLANKIEGERGGRAPKRFFPASIPLNPL